MYTTNVAKSIFAETRLMVLRELAFSKDEFIHQREIARRTGLNHAGVQRELKNLLKSGIVIEEITGNLKRYKLNEQCPIYDELRMIIIKTFGVADEIRKALKPLENRIHKAFIYGSFASGTYDSQSDIDIMVVGDIGLIDIAGKMREVSMMLKREINTVVFDVEEYNRKRQEDGFIKRVESEAKIMLTGDSELMQE